MPGPGGARIERACDRLLEIGVVSFAVWTLIYQACLVLRLGAAWAVGATALALAPAVWLTVRSASGAAESPPRDLAPSGSGDSARDPRLTALLVVNLLAAVVAAVLFAGRSGPWVVTWFLWVGASGSALIYAGLRGSQRAQSLGFGLDIPVVAAWAVGLAVFSLFLVNPNEDDAYYVHLASWIAAHGRFPLADVLFSDQRFPALYYPPVAAYEALVGTLARVTSVSAPTIVYMIVPPLGSFVSVLALWRLLRSWRAPMVGLAISVSLVFLLFAGERHRTLGALFLARLWQGKVLLLAVLVALLFALLHEYAERPSPRRIVLLACAGVAAVGLSTSAIFVVPVIAAGCLAPLATRSPKRAGTGLLAAAGYPLAAGLVTLAVGGRTPDVYTARDVVPAMLAHDVLGVGVPAFVAILAVLAGPVLIPHRCAAAMVAATVLLIGCLLAPRVPLLIFELTGIGRALGRVTWAIPTAALVGMLVTGLGAWARAPVIRALPAAIVAAAMILFGHALWSKREGTRVATQVVTRPDWKFRSHWLASARLILAAAHDGDVVLAPQPLSWMLPAISGDVTTVSPRRFYTRALRDLPEARVADRLLLQRLVNHDVIGGRRAQERTGRVRAALRNLGVDLACVPQTSSVARPLIVAAGYAMPVAQDARVVCMAAGGPVPAR